jgi:GWxTD domain-containing protein
MRRAVLAFVSLILVTAPAWAQLSKKYATWPDGPAGLLLTQQERAAYKTITSDEAAQKFIDLFWAKRDPDLDTRVNEFKLEFEARVAAADKAFGEGETRGALTDRGKTLVLLGQPAQRGEQPIEQFLRGLYPGRRLDERAPRMGVNEGVAPSDTQANMFGISFNRAKGKADVWLYPSSQVPASVGVPARLKSVMFAFLDTEGNGHFEMQRKIRDSKWAVAALEAMPAADLLHPELTELPTYPLLPGTVAATADQLAWLSLDPAPWPAGAMAEATQGVETENIFPAWVAVILPGDVPAADLMVGRLTEPDGTVTGTFQEPVTGVAVKQGHLYELSLPAPTGSSKLQLAFAAQGTPVAVRSLDIEIEKVAPGATYITPLVAGAEVMDLSAYDAGTPFVYGGHHVVPRPEGHYTTTDTINFFCLVVRPAAAGDQPTADVSTRLYIGHNPASPKRPPRPVKLDQVSPNVFMMGSGLPLSFLIRPGHYTLKVEVTDPTSGVSRTTDLPIVIPGQAQ